MSELSSAIKAICEEKGLSYESVITTIESALAAAYRKDFGQKNQNIKVEFDSETGESKVFDVKTVVEDMPEEEPEEESEKKTSDMTSHITSHGSPAKSIKYVKTPKDASGSTPEDEEERKFNPKTEIQLTDARLIKKKYKIDDEIITKLEVPDSYGRMAAQTAKQVIVQKLREAEREMIFNEFKDKEKEVVSGVVQRQEGRFVLIDLGKSTGQLPAENQIFGEKYNPGERIKVYIKEVRSGAKGAEIILSRTSEEILKKVFYLEIPEISNGLVELKEVAREAGSRSKVAVWTDSENVDPIGSCVGQRGARIQIIISELGGEKVDIIAYDEDPAKFIANALSPAKILNVDINEKERKAEVKVLPDQLSLAIGKNGQNARLAARLTGWKIDIIGEEVSKKDEEDKEEDEKSDEEKEADTKAKKPESQKTRKQKSDGNVNVEEKETDEKAKKSSSTADKPESKKDKKTTKDSEQKKSAETDKASEEKSDEEKETSKQVKAKNKKDKEAEQKDKKTLKQKNKKDKKSVAETDKASEEK